VKTKQQLAKVILDNAKAEAKELLQHAEGVAEFVLKNFPDKIPDKFVRGERRNTKSAFLGRYRKPEETGQMMLQRLKQGWF
jgi:RNA polymerase-binding transcription factor DksA